MGLCQLSCVSRRCTCSQTRSLWTMSKFRPCVAFLSYKPLLSVTHAPSGESITLYLDIPDHLGTRGATTHPFQLITDIKDTSPCKALTEEHVKSRPFVLPPSIRFCSAASPQPISAYRSSGKTKDSYGFFHFLKESVCFYHVLNCCLLDS